MTEGRPERVSMAHLEETVGRLLDRLKALRERLEVSDARVAELDRALRSRSSTSDDPLGMADRLRMLEEENEMLRNRLERGADVVDRIQSRVRFLEERS
ncbi:MAG: hypothetical protein WEA09_12950 [Gemmatimonadota bacterium]